MTPALPASLLVIERGWLSANNILAFEGETACLVDSGYVSHADQTVALLEQALAGRRLSTLYNTHSHSDHIGGNAALQSRFACEIVVPSGLDATIGEWDEDALLLSPLGQQGARFRHDRLLAAGDEFAMGGLNWRALAVPGHDMDALAYYNPEQRILISGDALWENGFGVIFPELLGTAEGLANTRSTLDMLGRLPIDCVIPGHGAAFADVDTALRNAYRRLASFEQDIERLAWHSIKVITAFALMERRRIKRTAFAGFIQQLPFAIDINARYLGLPDARLSERLLSELLGAGALHEVDDHLQAA